MADAKKKKPPEKYSPLDVATFRALWESGRFSTVADFKKYGDEHFKRFPSLPFLNKRISEEAWDKNKTTDELERRAEESFVEHFEEQGMNRVEIVKRICYGIDGPNRFIKMIADYCKGAGGPIDDETLKKMMSALDNEQRTALEFIREANKLCGHYPALKHKIASKIKYDDTKSMSPEEAAKEHARIHKNFVAAGLHPGH